MQMKMMAILRSKIRVAHRRRQVRSPRRAGYSIQPLLILDVFRRLPGNITTVVLFDNVQRKVDARSKPESLLLAATRSVPDVRWCDWGK